MRKVLFGLLLGAALLLGCETVDDARTIPGEFDKSGQEIHLTVVFYPTISELRAAYRKHAPDDTDEGILGYSYWVDNSDPHVCTMHVAKPQHDADKRMMTMGHELLHCLIGRYHK